MWDSPRIARKKTANSSSNRALKRETEIGTIVAVSTSLGRRVAREELVAAVILRFDQGVIEEALGDDALRVLPEAIRLVELRARVPWYQREMLHYFARQEGRSVDDVLTRELEDMACANAEELRAAVPGFGAALEWPSGEG